jgi:hypothetical protein
MDNGGIRMKRPSFLLCLLVQALKSCTWLYAWVLVPIGMLVGCIRKGPPSKTQWACPGVAVDGVPVPMDEIPSIVATGMFGIFDLPDEPSIGQYEPTVHRIYRRFGWHIAVWYQMALRNVGHGWPYRWVQWNSAWTLANGHPLPPFVTVFKLGFLPVCYGLRPYAAWRQHPDAISACNPMQRLSWYYVPWVGIRPDWAGAA